MSAPAHDGDRRRAWPRLVLGLFVGGWLVVVVVAYSRGCYSCPCEKTSLRLLSASGSAAFVGSFEGEHPLSLPQGEYRVLTFRVLETLRGTLGTTVEVRTGSGTGRCGITLETGETVGVVAYSVPPGLVTEPCSVVEPGELRSLLSSPSAVESSEGLR